MSMETIHASLQEVLGIYSSNKLLVNAQNDVYEAYLFSLVVRAANQLHLELIYKNGLGNDVQQLVFRRSPGFLHGDPQFTHALIRIPGRESLEAHVGIRVQGVSGQSHECDVCLLKADECERSREFGVLPRSRALVLAIEAKYYSDDLPTNLGRAFLGLGREFRRAYVNLATNVLSPKVVAMILHHGHSADGGVLPDTASHSRLISRIVERIYVYQASGRYTI